MNSVWKLPLYLSPDVGSLRSERPRFDKEYKVISLQLKWINLNLKKYKKKKKQWETPSPHTVTTKTELTIKDCQKTKLLLTSEQSVKTVTSEVQQCLSALRNIKRIHGVCRIFPLALE